VESSAQDRREARLRRHQRVRRQVSGSSEKPRLCVFRSSRHIYAQLIDDTQGITIASASSQSPELRESIGSGGNAVAAREVGKLVAVKAQEAGIGTAVFDRGGYRYHGRVQALADAARAAGLDMGPASDRQEIVAKKAARKGAKPEEEAPKGKGKGKQQQAAPAQGKKQKS